MNPWKIIGWIVLVGMLLSLTFCGLVCVRMAKDPAITGASASGGEPVYHAEVQSLSCQERYGRTEASVTIRNTGGNPIPYAKAFFRIGTESTDTYFSPSTIPAGSLASADKSVVGSGDCQLVMIQDRDGHQVMFTSTQK